MNVKEFRCSFLQIETLIGPLTALQTPSVPFEFMLSEALYRDEIGNAISGAGQRQMPWHDRFGKLFWFYYLEQKGASFVTPKQAWRGLVPLQTEPGGTVAAAWLPGSVDIRSYVYPWGIALLVDVQTEGNWPLDGFVDLGFAIRRDNKYDWTEAGKTESVSLNGLIDRAIAGVRRRAYGPGIAAGQTGETFSIVSVLDADGASPIQPVEDQSDLHRTFEALSSWSPVWKTATLKKLQAHQIELKQSLAPPGHVLYGNRRGRVVWFPSGFASANPPRPQGLGCYHQNLVVSALQTESLCRLAQAVATQLSEGETVSQFSVTHHSCAKLAAGILGRLHGGNLNTYRSHSIRDQIQTTYLADVNSMRGAFSMEALS